MIDGLANWMDEKGFATIDDFRGLSVPKVTEWKHLDLNYKIVARIDQEKCIGCELCYIACWDGAHQCIHLDRAHARRRGMRPSLPHRQARFGGAVQRRHAPLAHSPRGRGGVRGLQSLLAGVSGGELHHDGAIETGQAERVVGAKRLER